MGYGVHDKDLKVLSRFIKQEFPSGTLTARALLQKATPPSSPIHHLFNWDEKDAAHRYRLSQARKFIGSLTIEYGGQVAREYTFPIYTGAQTKEFVSTRLAIQNQELWKQVLDRAMQDALSFKARYEHLKEIRPITKAIVEVEKKVNRRK